MNDVNKKLKYTNESNNTTILKIVLGFKVHLTPCHVTVVILLMKITNKQAVFLHLSYVKIDFFLNLDEKSVDFCTTLRIFSRCDELMVARLLALSDFCLDR